MQSKDNPNEQSSDQPWYCGNLHYKIKVQQGKIILLNTRCTDLNFNYFEMNYIFFTLFIVGPWFYNVDSRNSRVDHWIAH